jgi:hypothetical protein
MKMSTFEKLVQLYRAIKLDSAPQGVLTLEDSEQIVSVKELLGKGSDDTGLTLISGDPESLSVGTTLRLEVNPPRRGIGILASDLADLVAMSRVSEPRNYYIRSDNYLKGEESPPTGLAVYKAVLSFVKLLAESSAYLDIPNEELIFIRDGRFVLPVTYGVSAFNSQLVGEIESLLSQFNGDMHREQKLEILASTTYDLTYALKPDKRFEALLAGMTELSKKVADGYRLFASGFSYDKIKGEIQDANIEFTGKIHKNFSDIQSQLLAIPVATVIVATQMKHAQGTDSQFWINTGVVLGSLIFAVLTWILVLNQRQTMTVLGEEIDRREQNIAKNHQQVKDLFEQSFAALRKRLLWQKRILNVVCTIVAVGLVATIVVYSYLLYLP